MSQENQSCLRFSLEESLWFRKGQEVAELVSISLDPDITIQENDQYVTIRGSLELTGEYRNDQDSTGEEEENVPSQKYVERVDPQEEGICEFSHRFPVDITIPNNRIQSIYDIDVIVESFDYSIPERSCLKLSAELTISGLYDSTQEEEEVVEEEEFEVLHRYQVEVPKMEEQEEAEEENHFADTFLFEAEARKQPEEEKVEAFPKFPTFTYEEPEEEEELQQPQQPVVFEHARSEAVEPVQEIEEIVEKAPVQPIAEEKAKEPAEAKEPVMEESSSSPEAPPKQAKKKAQKKKTMTLTEFFARKEDSSDQARLKVCIVQKGDTLDSLADRYDVSVPNLLRYNNLELNQDVYEGQVLYVPVALAKK
ncbi:stage VI sporulation protein D [Neobacillus niacini]|uniref:stage VI sporulation protein D n=1 Tax=Neobacillus niacini TaxID=86668 RepID=UPI0007AB3A61|nr:stage VI sporulation protein D [Neobacillus niacini]MEC1521768.1 stage VI sporulation protein D [Neobacillus niacini]